jgi:hypothetical protein
MRSNATTAWDYFDSRVFVAHRPGPLIEADFDHFLADVMARPGVTGVVVRGSQGAPIARQRAQLLRWYTAHSLRGAVLTDSMITRGGVTALSWFGVPIRAFDSQQLDAALAFVGIAPERIEDAHQLMGQLISRVDRDRGDGPNAWARAR